MSVRGGSTGTVRNMPPHSLEDPMAWVVCAICALLGVLAYGFESSVLSWGLTPRQVGTWLSMALLVGLWMVPSLPPLFAVLLALLVMSLFDLAPIAVLLSGTVSDAALWWLGAFSLSVAARQSGLTGALMARALHSLQAPHTPRWRRAPAVWWLAMVFALLPSSAQARRWVYSFCLVPSSTPRQVPRDVVSAAQLGAALAWLPAQPANLLVLALLPAGGVDRFVPAYWLQHTWPLLALALAYASCVQWCARPALGGVTPLPQVVLGSRELSEDRFAVQCVVGIAAVMVLMVALQPLHGFSPGLVSLLAMVVLFATKVLTPQSYHWGVDWPLFVCATVLPGLIASFAAAIPAWGLEWGSTSLALPFLFCLRMVVPSGVAIVAALVLATSWSSVQGHDLLDTAIAVLVAFHMVDFMFRRHTGAGSQARMLVAWATVRSPVTWAGCAVYYLWWRWCGW